MKLKPRASNNLVLLGLRARLEEVCLDGEVALATAKTILNMLRDRSEYQRESTDSGIGQFETLKNIYFFHFPQFLGTFHVK